MVLYKSKKRFSKDGVRRLFFDLFWIDVAMCDTLTDVMTVSAYDLLEILSEV